MRAFRSRSLAKSPPYARFQSSVCRSSACLKPAGRIFLYGPYAINPYRRRAEARDDFEGTVEKCFGVTQLRRLLSTAGLEIVSLERHVCTASEWKLTEFNSAHRVLRKLYVAVSKQILWLFGDLMVVAEKRA